jgi:hypothetical protein
MSNKKNQPEKMPDAKELSTEELLAVIDTQNAQLSSLKEDKLVLEEIIAQLNQTISGLEKNQSVKNIVVKNSNGAAYKLKNCPINYDGKIYAAADIVDLPNVVDGLIEMQSGFITPVQ